MRFSFIVPIYKVEQYLSLCIESILAQTYKDFEIILVDDGSPDNSPLLCDEWATKDSRISVIHKQNGGLSSARNEGLKKAQGNYIIFLDSDDWWCDNAALERIVTKIDESNADIVFIASKKYYTLKNEYVEKPTAHHTFAARKDISIEDSMRNSLFIACAWDKVIRRSILVDNNINFVERQLSEDIEWCCKLLLLDLKYACIDGIVHVYRQQNASSITANITNKNLSDIYSVVCKYVKIAEDTNNSALRNFLALEAILWMSITNYATGEEGDRLIKNMGKFFYLTRYNLYPRVNMVSKIKFLGYNIVRKLLIVLHKLH